IRYLDLTGRSAEQLMLVENYAREQGLWHDPDRQATYSDYLELDLSTVVPSIAGPKRPQDRIALTDAKNAFRHALADYADDDDSAVDEAGIESFPASDSPAVSSGNGGGEPRTSISAAVGAQGRVSSPTPVRSADDATYEI